MQRIKEVVLWTVIVLAFTPIAFVLMPVIVVAGIIGSIATFVNSMTDRQHHMHHA